jgi:hypothetical protein
MPGPSPIKKFYHRHLELSSCDATSLRDASLTERRLLALSATAKVVDCSVDLTAKQL